MRRPIHLAIITAAAMALAACGGTNNQRTAGNTGAGNNPPANTASNQAPETAAGNPQPSGTAERSANSNLNSAERQFLTDTAESTLAGLQMAQMASARATSTPVRNFAQQLAGIYQSRLSQLRQIASGNGVTLPNNVNSAGRARIDTLGNLSGPQFDQSFLSAAISDGQRDATAFALEASNGSDQVLKKFASDALPQMQARQQYAQGMLAQIQGGNAGANANTYPRDNTNPNYNPPPPPQ